MRTSGFARNQSGSVAIMFALVFSTLIAAAAVVVDYSYAAWRQQGLQRASDTAAMAAAKLEANDATAVKAEAERLFSANVDTAGITPVVSIGNDTVTVEATYSQPTFMTQVIGHSTINVSARAVARRAVAKPCVITLDPTAINSLKLNSEGKLDANCKVQVNSNHAEAVYVSSSSILKSQSTCVVGGWTGSGTFTPNPTKCAAMADPLVSLPAPPEATGPCTKTNYSLGAQTVTLNPGVYCDGLTMDGTTATLNPGIYVIRNGLFKLSSGAKVTGSGVLLFFIGTGARMEMVSSTSLDLKPPTSGTYANIVIFQDRNTSTDFFHLNSKSDTRLEGTIYLPNSPIKMNSDADMVASPYLSVIVRRIELNSKASIIARNTRLMTAAEGAVLVK
jgi:Flp pilus assembly protein TadG